MKKDELHPLDYWLLDKDQSLPSFATANKIAVRTLYEHVNGELANPGILVMQAIEKATKRAVTVQKQADWWRRK